MTNVLTCAIVTIRLQKCSVKKEADTVRKMQERLKAKSEVVYGDRAVCVELIDEIAEKLTKAT